MRYLELIRYQGDVVVSAGQAICGCALLLVVLGVTSLVGIGIVCIGVIAQVGVGRIVWQARSRATALADERMRLTHEVLASLTAVKLQAWESPTAGSSRPGDLPDDRSSHPVHSSQGDLGTASAQVCRRF